jgi:Nucleoside-diphosphate-sugar pyrophosphorylase involved in lipopolysaccharide biosynthesis/translation initiation factor 2B, gamma/epsilon subunits (eIF-2Bgamma/eIF-2Bepsilon)
MSFSLENEVFPAVVKKRELNAVEVISDFIDIGIPEDYFRFCEWIKKGKTSEL